MQRLHLGDLGDIGDLSHLFCIVLFKSIWSIYIIYIYIYIHVHCSCSLFIGNVHCSLFPRCYSHLWWSFLLEKFQDTIYPIMYNLSLYIYSPCTIYSTQTHPRTCHPGLLLAPLGMPMSSMHSRKMHICITLFDLMCSTFSFKNEKICLPNCTQICPLEGSSDKNSIFKSHIWWAEASLTRPSKVHFGRRGLKTTLVSK